MTNNKFNALFIQTVIKPAVDTYIQNGYVNREAIQNRYLLYKNESVTNRVLTPSQKETFILSNKEITKNKLI